MEAADSKVEGTISVMEDLRKLLEDGKDVERVQSIQRMHEEVIRLCQSREGQIKATIRALANQVLAAETRAMPPEPSHAHTERLDSIRREARAAWANIDRLHKDKQQLEQYYEALREQAHTLEGRRRYIEDLVTQEMPRTFNEISLYAHISNIAWDYEAKDRVKGHIPDPVKGDIISFDFDARQTSQFDITNQLWDIMD